MGKSTTTNTCQPPPSKHQADGWAATTNNEQQQPPRCSLMNYVLFVLCTLSLGCTAYAAYRQCHVDDTRIRHIRRLDERITVLEEQLRLIAETTTKTKTTKPSSSDDIDVQSLMRRISIANNNATTSSSSFSLSPSSSSSSSSTEEENAFTYPAAEMLQALQKLSLHDSGIERLRRDISQLQSSRTVRQSSMIQSSPDCGCPAGEYYR